MFPWKNIGNFLQGLSSLARASDRFLSRVAFCLAPGLAQRLQVQFHPTFMVIPRCSKAFQEKNIKKTSRYIKQHLACQTGIDTYLMSLQKCRVAHLEANPPR
jgi:hypothetical protein